MANRSKIEWTDHTWNCVRGCSPVSDGCKFCYAARFAHRFSGEGNRYEGLTRMTEHGAVWNGKVREIPEFLEAPLRWKKPRRIFVNSMSDLFHDDVSPGFIDQVLEVMMACPQHTFQVLTKRPENLDRKLYEVTEDTPVRALGGGDYVPNLWIGVSVENQEAADKRIPPLLRIPAAVRFVSIEPMLGPVDLIHVQWPGKHRVDVLRGGYWEDREVFFKGFVNHSDMQTIKWVVCGCESGYGARPMDLDWVRSIRDQCQRAEVPFFFKQRIEDGKKIHMPELDGRVWDEYPCG